TPSPGRRPPRGSPPPSSASACSSCCWPCWASPTSPAVRTSASVGRPTRAPTADDAAAAAPDRCDGWNLRPDPPRSPRRRQRGPERVRAGRGHLRPHGPSVAEGGPGDLRRRASLPDDGGRHRREPRVHRLRVDIDRPGATYTADTLRDLGAQHPDADLFFITGADALQSILTWKNTEQIFELAH